MADSENQGEEEGPCWHCKGKETIDNYPYEMEEAGWNRPCVLCRHKMWQDYLSVKEEALKKKKEGKA